MQQEYTKLADQDFEALKENMGKYCSPHCKGLAEEIQVNGMQLHTIPQLRRSGLKKGIDRIASGLNYEQCEWL